MAKKIQLVVVSNHYGQKNVEGSSSQVPAAEPRALCRTIEGDDLFVPRMGDSIPLNRQVPGVHKVRMVVPDIKTGDAIVGIQVPSSIAIALTQYSDDWDAHSIPLEDEALQAIRDAR